jgi:adenylate cyclase class IV
MHQFEIEIKSLLGSKEQADLLISKMKAADAGLVELGSHKQLNHYFTEVQGNLQTLFDKVKSFLKEEDKVKLEDLAKKAKDFSVRTRDADGKIILVVKASVDDTTSQNGTARLEFESRFEKLNEISQLDDLVLSAGFEYQAKWSRERQEFVYHTANRTVNVSLDKNAGYGYLSEFEVVVSDQNKADEVKAFIRETMTSLGISELSQDRLARMFDYYNKNWRDYYGTEKIFVIE